jgi:hypothetical protein
MYEFILITISVIGVELGIVHSVVCVWVGFGAIFCVGEPTMVVVAVQGAPSSHLFFT